jgi:hypothetical protein
MLRLHVLIDFPVSFMEEPEHQNNQNQNQHTRHPGDYALQKTIHVASY